MARKRNRARRGSGFIRKKRSSSGVSIFARLLPLALLAALIGLAIKGGQILFFDSEYFNIKTMAIEGDNTYEDLKPLASYMNAKKGMNIFSVDLKRDESYICSKHPDLKNVRVKRVLPDIIEVSYDIRRPFLQVDSGDFYLVSDDMSVLTNPRKEPDPILPIVMGVNISEKKLSSDRRSYSPELKKAVFLLKEIEGSSFSKRHKVVKIDMHDINNPALFIEDTTRIEIGEYTFKEREKLLEEILDDLESKGKGAKVIDLRFEDAVVIPR